ncbi:hypothetical protein NDU88_003704 [Pleurodeles waltl]|uniref:Uncharacterized protein n=1 Tax=Pleurodeles waltl TaxID=8319 RepID=A0AAV7QCU4_PLEWA|nr:hypothetical protein NDU88_003704 [Pleurodeles waltl]
MQRKHLSNYAGKALMLVSKYAEKALKPVSKYAEKALKLVSKYAEKALKHQRLDTGSVELLQSLAELKTANSKKLAVSVDSLAANRVGLNGQDQQHRTQGREMHSQQTSQGTIRMAMDLKWATMPSANLGMVVLTEPTSYWTLELWHRQAKAAAQASDHRLCTVSSIEAFKDPLRPSTSTNLGFCDEGGCEQRSFN